MKSNRWFYVGIFLISALSSKVFSAQCPDLKINIQNTSNQTVTGGIWGNTGNVGSSGYSVAPGKTTDITLYTQDYPGGSFGLVGNYQWFGSTYNYVTCIAEKKIPAVNGCPDPSWHPRLVIFPNRCVMAANPLN